MHTTILYSIKFWLLPIKKKYYAICSLRWKFVKHDCVDCGGNIPKLVTKEPLDVGHAGKPLSILDGIFMAIKDDIDCLPHPSKGKIIIEDFFFFFCKSILWDFIWSY